MNEDKNPLSGFHTETHLAAILPGDLQYLTHCKHLFLQAQPGAQKKYKAFHY